MKMGLFTHSFVCEHGNDYAQRAEPVLFGQTGLGSLWSSCHNKILLISFYGDITRSRPL